MPRFATGVIEMGEEAELPTGSLVVDTRPVSIPAILSIVDAGEPVTRRAEVIELSARDAVIQTGALLEKRKRIVLRLLITDPAHGELLELGEDINGLKGRYVNAQGSIVESALNGENSYWAHVRFSGHFKISRSGLRNDAEAQS